MISTFGTCIAVSAKTLENPHTGRYNLETSQLVAYKIESRIGHHKNRSLAEAL